MVCFACGQRTLLRASDSGSERGRTSSTIARVPSPWQSPARPGSSRGRRGRPAGQPTHDADCHGRGFRTFRSRRDHDAQEWPASSARAAGGFSAGGSPGPHKTWLRRGFDKTAPCVTILSVKPVGKAESSDSGRGTLLRSPFPVPKWRNWQTRMVQVHVLARVWGFESLLRHQKF